MLEAALEGATSASGELVCHFRPMCDRIGAKDDWALALASTLAEAAGARLMVSDAPQGLFIGFAGAGEDPRRAEEAWLLAREATHAHSRRWCRGFAQAVDNALDARIGEPETKARVERVVAWLAIDEPVETTPAPVLEAEGRDAERGRRAGERMARRLDPGSERR